MFGCMEDVPIDIGSFLQSQIMTSWHALVHDQDRTHGGSRLCEVYVRWVASPSPWITLNTDGASQGEAKLAGGGGILRDCRGSFIHEFPANFGSCSAYKAELATTAIGLELAKDLGITKLVLQMDNKACLEVLQDAHHHGGECVHLLNSCRKLLNSEEWEVRLSHSYREGNKLRIDWRMWVSSKELL